MWLSVHLALLVSAPALGKENLKLQDLSITAQKQEENYKDIPISMNVLDEFDIEDKGIENYVDLVNHVSNMTIFDAGGTDMRSTFMRGVAADNGVESANVGIYVDGVPYVNTFGNIFAMDNLERIEVLKGPQSVLYGKNSYAGVVNIISRKPTGYFSGNVGVQAGSDNKRRYSLTLNSPTVVEKLSASVQLSHTEKDGFIRNTTLNEYDNHKDRNFGRLHLLYTASDALSFSLISTSFDREDGGIAWNLPTAPDRLVVTVDQPGINETHNRTHAFKVDYAYGAHAVSAVTSYKNLDNTAIYDADFTPDLGFHVDADMAVEEYSQEVRFSGRLGAVDYLAGVYADVMRKDRVLLFNGVQSQVYDTEARTLSVFANGSLELAPKLTLSAGARVDQDTITLDDNLMGLDDENDYTHVSPKLSLSYALNEQATVYGTLSRGYKAGGYYLFAPEPSQRWVEKETMTNYEVGGKAYLLDNRLALGASAFFMDIKDKQVSTHIDGFQSYVENAARSETLGFEIDADLQVTSALHVQASLGYADSEFQEFSDALGDYSGNKNPFSPKHTYSLGATYRDQRGFFATITWRGQAKSYTDKENINETDAYDIVNAKLGYEAEQFEIYAYGNNLTDEVYDTNFGLVNYLSPPREAGVEVKLRF